MQSALSSKFYSYYKMYHCMPMHVNNCCMYIATCMHLELTVFIINVCVSHCLFCGVSFRVALGLGNFGFVREYDILSANAISLSI